VSYRWVRTEPLRIFIGYDSKEPVAYHVLAHSILRRASVPVSITPLVQSALRVSGIYTRDRGATESTEFSLTRFLVPHLCGYQGQAVFMDSDMLCQVDVAELWESILEQSAAVLVAQHDFTPTATTKFLGQPQTAYPRKCWSAFMAFDNTRCRELTPGYVNAATGLELHRLLWADDAIGSLPLDWGWLVGVYAPKPDARVLHWTDGGPWFDEYRNADHADRWFAERAAMLHAAQRVAV
jgi:hypothetical protein